MKIAYFSPFNPLKSGISDFSEELVLQLKKYMEITLFAANGEVSNPDMKQEFEVYNIKDYSDSRVREKFDAAVFHIGNNYKFHKEIAAMFLKYGGILELHDVALHHYLAEATVVRGRNDEYLQTMEYCHGRKGRKRAEDFLAGKKAAPWEEESLKYPVNKYLIDKAQAVIVHSDFAYEIVRGIRQDVPLIKIELHSSEILRCSEEQKKNARAKLNIAPDKLVLGAFGYASPQKRTLQILEALALYARKHEDFHFYFVGKAVGIKINSEITRLGLQDKVTVTGFVDLDDFKLYITACDIAFNLRYPTQGESSGSLVRLLGQGKAVFVTSVGSFRELPDDVVIKIEYGDEEIKQIYQGLLQVRDKRNDYAANANAYALKNNCLEVNAEKYFRFFQDVTGRKIIEADFQDALLDEIFRLGLDDNAYITDLCQRLAY